MRVILLRTKMRSLGVIEVYPGTLNNIQIGLGPVMAKRIFWHDGNFFSFGRFDQIEVEFGWLVVVQPQAYQEIRGEV